eukprot:CAMPEP_0170197652 /NCGR_PEP_ID=MMETSP0040_2-20121228/66856_1 /TAXON_ID=641309 /ORGANISM="Lotharella oceanica, Strain CCMP622" /LENGTH=164 /DNA_ID=CAMNT_0010447369 /DNA_START=693 /DNA_END=1187 /DNA_ORIENTATION=+
MDRGVKATVPIRNVELESVYDKGGKDTYGASHHYEPSVPTMECMFFPGPNLRNKLQHRGDHADHHSNRMWPVEDVDHLLERLGHCVCVVRWVEGVACCYDAHDDVASETQAVGEYQGDSQVHRWGVSIPFPEGSPLRVPKAHHLKENDEEDSEARKRCVGHVIN